MDPLQTVSIGRGGWVRLDLSPEGPAYVRFAARPSGHLGLTELYARGKDGLTAAALRELPLTRLEVWANSPEARALLLEHLFEPAPDLARLVGFYATAPEADGDDWVSLSMRAQDPESGLVQPVPPSERPGPSRQRAGRSRPRGGAYGSPERPATLKVELPSTKRYPDDFYEGVARIFARLVWTSERPAVEIAEANEVPTTTVHAWVREARKRGFLGEGTKGRAG